MHLTPSRTAKRAERVEKVERAESAKGRDGRGWEGGGEKTLPRNKEPFPGKKNLSPERITVFLRNSSCCGWVAKNVFPQKNNSFLGSILPFCFIFKFMIF